MTAPHPLLHRWRRASTTAARRLLLLASLGGCATLPRPQGNEAASASPPAETLRGVALASLLQTRPLAADAALGDRPPAAPQPPRRTTLYEAELPAATWERIVALDDEHAQRRFALLWTGIETWVADQVLAEEAARRKCSVATLLRDEVESQVGSPSDDEIRDLYATYRQQIPGSFSSARTQLAQIWRDDRATQLRQALVDRLREGSEVRLALEAPRLSRHAVRLGNAPRRGAADAPVTVVAFGDYECPYSAQARRLLQRLEQLYPEQLQVVYRDFVLPQHRRGLAAARAAACAAEQGSSNFWAYYNLLYDNNQRLGDADLLRYARQAELDNDRFAACLASERPARSVAASLEDAGGVNITGTPALFVNGMRIQGVLPLPLMQAIVEHELATPTG